MDRMEKIIAAGMADLDQAAAAERAKMVAAFKADPLWTDDEYGPGLARAVAIVEALAHLQESKP